MSFRYMDKFQEFLNQGDNNIINQNIFEKKYIYYEVP